MTNKHIIDFCRMNKQKFLRVGQALIEIDEVLIDSNDTLDLATIKITQDHLQQICKYSYKEPYCPEYGPPSDFTELVDEMVTITGFPGVFRIDSSDVSTLEYAAFTGPISDVSEISLTIPMELEKCEKIFGYRDPELFRIRLGGFSGGGVFFLKNDGTIHLAGIIKEDLGSFLLGFKATPSRLIMANGEIDKRYDLHR